MKIYDIATDILQVNMQKNCITILYKSVSNNPFSKNYKDCFALKILIKLCIRVIESYLKNRVSF